MIGSTNSLTIIQGGGVSTQPQSIFTGYTAPLTWLNSTNNVFEYKSATHNITITGLSNVATIVGNGTKNVTVTIDTTASSDRQTAFTITCVKDNQTVTYNGIEFHYGSDLGSNSCIGVVQTVNNGQIAYTFIESVSLPTFESATYTWNGAYGYQIISFDFGNYRGTQLSSGFLSFCYSFNQPVTIPNNITVISYRCLSSCYSFNQPLTIPSSVRSIDYSFLAYCYSFNQPLTIPNNVLWNIGDSFLQYCYSFNQPLTIPNNVSSLGKYFLQYCYSFNQPLTIENSNITIGNSFLFNCYSFNQPVIIPNNMTGADFLRGCTSFNQPLSIPNNVTKLEGFLHDCTSFNQPLTIPSSVTTLKFFLWGCYSFNQPLTIPSSVTTIDTNFLRGCYSFNQPLTIPSSVTSVGAYFLNSCESFTFLEYNASVYPTDNNSLSQTTNSKTSTNGTGVLVTGTHASDLKAALPDRTSSPYRKLVLAGV